jgi:hypothetical protein
MVGGAGSPRHGNRPTTLGRRPPVQHALALLSLSAIGAWLVALMLLLALLGCADFWAMKPIPRAYSHDDRSPYTGR